MVADPSLGTGLTVLGGAIGLKELIVKVLGPTADYLGSGLKEFTERRAQNLQRIFESAGRLLGDQLEAPGTVPPKVLKGILGEGQFCEDELSAEYFGGVLASSRTDVARDDRGATFVALLGRLSTYQIRSHFFFYTLFREIYLNSGVNFGIQIGRSQLQTFFPASSYTTALELTEKEASHDLANHAVVGLVREMLIDQNFSIGNRDHIRTGYGQADSDGLLIAPSILGAELYLWALGKGVVHLRRCWILLSNSTRMYGFRRHRGLKACLFQTVRFRSRCLLRLRFRPPDEECYSASRLSRLK